MNRPFTRREVVLVLSLLVLRGCSGVDHSDLRTVDWPVYSADAAGTKYSPLRQINRDNVHRLGIAWVYRTDDMREEPRSTIECNPVIVDGRIYLTSPGLKVIALDALAGKEMWRFDPFQGKRASGVNRGVTYWEEGDIQRIFFVAGPYLYSINAVNGTLDSGFGEGGRVAEGRWTRRTRRVHRVGE